MIQYKMIKFKFFLLLLMMVLSIFGYSQAPTLIASGVYKANGSGASGVPTVSFNIPAGKNRLMIITAYAERVHSPTVASNYLSTPDGSIDDGNTLPIQVNGIQASYISGPWATDILTSANTTILSTQNPVRYVSDAMGLPTGTSTITFTGINLPENGGDEIIVNIAVFANANPNPALLNWTNVRNFNTTNILTLSATTPTIPVGNTINNITFFGTGGISQEKLVSFSSGWTAIQPDLITNTSGSSTNLANLSPNELDGIGLTTAYANIASGNPSFTLTRTATNPSTEAASANLISILPLARPSVSGTVYRDNNGLTGGINNGGTGGGVWSLANILYVNAIDTNGNVIATTTVDGSGVFTFPTGGALIEGNIITFQLSKNQGVVGQPAPVKELPLGWGTVGESIASGTSDGTPNGEFGITIGAANSPNDTTNRFGVTQTSSEVLCTTGATAARQLFGFFGDTNQPSGATGPHLQPTSQGSPISSLITASNMTASSNVSISAQSVGSVTTIRVGNINTSTTTPVDYTAFSDYIFSTWSLAANSPIVRLDATRINTVSGGSGANFRARITVFDVATSTETIVLSDALFNSTAGTEYDLSAYNLLPGKTYQIRIYLSKAGAAGGTPVTLDIDNPVFFGAPIPNVNKTILYIPCPGTTLPLSTLNSNVTSQTPTNYELRWFNGSNVNVTSLTNIPVGTYTAYYFSTANSCYQPASTPVTVALGYSTLDSDGDGLPNDCDLDDDNDGILDSLESPCLSNVAVSDPNPNVTVTNNGLAISITENVLTTNVFTDSGVGFAGLEPNQGAMFTYNFSPFVNNLKLWFADLDNREYLKVNYYDKDGNRITNILPYITANVGSAKNLSYDATYGLLIDPTNNAGGLNNASSQYLEVTIPFAISKVEVSLNSTRADGTAYASTASTPEVYIKGLCIGQDTDGDSTPDYLDLDSDNDGCVDAREGDENVTAAQLITASGTVTVGTGSTASNQNLGVTVNSNGVPVLVNSGGAADIGGDQGQGVGVSQDSSANSCIDTDGDGIPNIDDIDDDNDGITDTNEGKCSSTAIYLLDEAATVAGAAINQNGGSFNLIFKLQSGSTPVPSIGNQFTIPLTYSGMTGSTDFWEGINSLGSQGLGIRPNTTSLYTGLPASNSTTETSTVTPFYADPIFNNLLTSNKITQLGTYSVTTGAPPVPISSDLATLSSDVFTLHSAWNLTTSGSTLLNGYYSRVTLQNLLVDYGDFAETEYLTVKYGKKYDYFYTAFTNTAGSGTGNGGNRGFIQLRDVSITYCIDRDTDGDGTPDYLDLDSDNDGCVDAIEGDENVTTAQLVTASGTVTVGTGSTASNQNLGNTVDANGVPTVVNSGGAADIGADQGQGVGSSANAAVNTCFCYKPGILDAGNTYPTKHGITALGRAGSDNDNWPMVRQSGWTVLESKTKGFVVNRVAFTDADSNPATPDVPTGISAANFVEGMMVYDTTNNCLKVYTSANGGTTFAWHCMTTQTCPQ